MGAYIGTLATPVLPTNPQYALPMEVAGLIPVAAIAVHLAPTRIQDLEVAVLEGHPAAAAAIVPQEVVHLMAAELLMEVDHPTEVAVLTAVPTEVAEWVVAALADNELK